jgi:MFS family permease
MRDLFVVATSLFFWGVGESAFLYFQPLYLQQLGASPVRIGAILGASGVAMAIAHIPAGYLADRLGRRPILWASWIMGMLAAWIMAAGKSLPIFVAGMLLYSVTSFVMAPLNSYLTAARGRWSVGRVLTLISAFYNSGAILGPLLGGWIGDRFGLRQVYLLAAAMFVLSTFIILLIRPQPLEAPHAGVKQNGIFLAPRFTAYLGIVFLAMFAMTLPQPLSPNFLQNERGLSLGQIGQLGSIASLGLVALNLSLGLTHARTGFILSQLAVGIYAFSLWRGNGMAAFAVGYFLVGGSRTGRAFASAQSRNLAPSARMGLAYGIIETVNSAAMILAYPLAGLFYSIDPVRVYPYSLGLILISILVGLVFNPAGVKQSAEPQEGQILGQEIPRELG